jgi:hypothetical protein
MDAVLPGPSSPPSNPPVIAATPRRHLKTLSLASTTPLGDGSPGSPASLISRASASALGASSPLSPAGRPSRSPNPRPPLSPSPAVARKGSLARGPRRTSSISYSPSARLEGSGGLSADGRPALLSPSHGRRPASPSQLRPASATWLGDLAEGDDSSTDGQDGLVAVSPGASVTAPPSSSLHSHARWGSRTNLNASGGDVERSALTLAERCVASSLLSSELIVCPVLTVDASGVLDVGPTQTRQPAQPHCSERGSLSRAERTACVQRGGACKPQTKLDCHRLPRLVSPCMPLLIGPAVGLTEDVTPVSTQPPLAHRRCHRCRRPPSLSVKDPARRVSLAKRPSKAGNVSSTSFSASRTKTPSPSQIR